MRDFFYKEIYLHDKTVVGLWQTHVWSLHNNEVMRWDLGRERKREAHKNTWSPRMDSQSSFAETCFGTCSYHLLYRIKAFVLMWSYNWTYAKQGGVIFSDENKFLEAMIWERRRKPEVHVTLMEMTADQSLLGPPIRYSSKKTCFGSHEVNHSRVPKTVVTSILLPDVDMIMLISIGLWCHLLNNNHEPLIY